VQTIAISEAALLSLPHDDLIALYNAESKRLAGPLTPHQVDETCKPLYIVKLLAKLPIRYQMLADQASNESAAMLSRPLDEAAEQPATKTERARESAPLNGVRPFSLMK
jgi:hypothetical protein